MNRFCSSAVAVVLALTLQSTPARADDAASEACVEQAENEIDASTLRFLQGRLNRLRSNWENGTYAHALDGAGIYRRSSLEAGIESLRAQLARLIAEGEGAFVTIRAGENSATNIRDAIDFFAEQGDIAAMEDQLEALEIWFTNLSAKKQSLREQIAERQATLERLREWYAFEIDDIRLEMIGLVGPAAAAEHCLDEVSECQSHVLSRYGPFDETADNIVRLLELRGQLVAIDPPPLLPAQITLDEHVDRGTGTIKIVGWQRWVADTSASVLGTLSVFASFDVPFLGLNPTGLNALQNAAGAYTAWRISAIAGNEDEIEVPIDKARQIYENYKDLQSGGMRERALREQSCMLMRLEDRIASQRLLLADYFAEVETSLDLPACRNMAHDILDMDEERRRFEEHHALADPAHFEAPTYALDLTGCTL